MNIFDHYSNRYERTREEEYSLQEYLDLCKRDPLAYASAAERMLDLPDPPTAFLAASMLSGSRLQVCGSISAKTGFRPFHSTECAVAAKEYGVVMTSPVTRRACSAVAMVSGFIVEPGSTRSVTARLRRASGSAFGPDCWHRGRACLRCANVRASRA